MDKIGDLQISIADWDTVSIDNLDNNDSYKPQNSECRVGSLLNGRGAERCRDVVLASSRTCSCFTGSKQNSHGISRKGLTTVAMDNALACAIDELA